MLSKEAREELEQSARNGYTPCQPAKTILSLLDDVDELRGLLRKMLPDTFGVLSPHIDEVCTGRSNCKVCSYAYRAERVLND